MKFMTFKWETNSIIIINDGTKFTGEDANCELGKEKKKRSKEIHDKLWTGENYGNNIV